MFRSIAKEIYNSSMTQSEVEEILRRNTVLKTSYGNLEFDVSQCSEYPSVNITYSDTNKTITNASCAEILTEHRKVIAIAYKNDNSFDFDEEPDITTCKSYNQSGVDYYECQPSGDSIYWE